MGLQLSRDLLLGAGVSFGALGCLRRLQLSPAAGAPQPGLPWPLAARHTLLAHFFLGLGPFLLVRASPDWAKDPGFYRGLASRCLTRCFCLEEEASRRALPAPLADCIGRCYLNFMAFAAGFCDLLAVGAGWSAARVEPLPDAEDVEDCLTEERGQESEDFEPFMGMEEEPQDSWGLSNKENKQPSSGAAASASAAPLPMADAEAGARARRVRPCKEKRQRLRRLVVQVVEECRRDPGNFDISLVQLPPYVTNNELVHKKFLRKVEMHAASMREALQEGGPEPRLSL